MGKKIKKTALFSLVLLMIFIASCETTEQGATKPVEPKAEIIKPQAPAEQKIADAEKLVKPTPEKKQIPASKAAQPTDIVAEIGDYDITREELEKRVVKQQIPNPDEYLLDVRSINAKEVLMETIIEKAVIMQSRENNSLEEETIRERIDNFRNEKLANLLLKNHIQDKIVISDSEIEAKRKSDPNMTAEQANSIIGREKARKEVEIYYNEVYKNLNCTKYKANYPEAVKIHYKMKVKAKSSKPEEGRGYITWITKKQVREEMTPEEAGLVLATFDGGEITLKDMLLNMCDKYSPPNRPQNLNSYKTLNKFLDDAIRLPLWAAQARKEGLDKDKTIIEQVREREDQTLLSLYLNELHRNLHKPSDEQAEEYFNAHKEMFMKPDTLKIDQIWCRELETAQKAKAELDSGEDFETVKQNYSLQKKSKPAEVNPASDGPFFRDIWQYEPNDIVGPVRGLHQRDVRWRVARILEKKPREIREYSKNLKRIVSSAIRDEEKMALLAERRKELLQKYPYKINTEIVDQIVPLDVFISTLSGK